jgi:type III pantothenate kinase
MAGKEASVRAVIIDVGNTYVRFVAWTAEDRLPRCTGGAWQPAPALRELGRLATPGSPADEAAFVPAASGLLASAGDVPVVVVSVVPRVEALLRGLVHEMRSADHTASLPFRHRLADPAATGADRLCNMAAAVGAGLDGALVVDAGTATTIDVMAGGVFIGGVIAPGMAFAVEQLGLRAARLRPVPFVPVPLAAGIDTFEAMSAGAFHAGVGGVEALICGLNDVHGPLPVVVTGGLGRFLARPDRFCDPQWTLRGAAFLCDLA